MTLTALGPGGGKSASIPLSGIAKDVNALAVTATDSVGNAKTAQVFFYLRGTTTGGVEDDSDEEARARKRTPVKKKTRGKKK